MAIAEVNNDHADALLLNRIAYYGIGVAVPYILMRHWEEWEKSRTITFDDTDHRLCELVMNIQYRTQQHWFGEYARKYYDDKNSDPSIQKQRSSKTKTAYGLLPECFTLDDVVKYYECGKNSASSDQRDRSRDSLDTSDHGLVPLISSGVSRQGIPVSLNQ